ncbi:uncharacterized protein LOC144125150 [Amblyomma americanum]
MKPTLLFAVAAILVLTLPQEADSLFLSSLALLPVSAIVSLGGFVGLKLAIAMKILGMLGWFDVSRYGVGLRASIDDDKLPDRVVPLPKPRNIFPGPTISVPVAMLPYFIGGKFKGPSAIRLPVKDFMMLANQSVQFDSPSVRFSSDGAASVKGTKGSSLHASGKLKSPLVNVEARKTAMLRGRRSIESDPNVIKQAVRLVRQLDTDSCILRLSCEVSAEPSTYGEYGRRVADFVNGLGPVGRNSVFADFEQAHMQGAYAGMAGCKRAYSKCKVDLRALVALVESS